MYFYVVILDTIDTKTCKPLEDSEMIVEGDHSVPGVSVDVNDLDILFLDPLRKHFIRQVGLDDSLLRLRKCPELYVIV